MSVKLEKITGDDEVFRSKEYISDSLIFNTIESARHASDGELYTDHKNVIIFWAKATHRVWLWTSSMIKDDTNKLIDICRFLRDLEIPKAEIYLKEDVAAKISDLYALTTLEIHYVIKDELSIAVFTLSKAKEDVPSDSTDIICIDKDDPNHVRLVTEFYEQLKEEFRWTEKFDRKLNEYLNTEMYALIKDGKMIANGVFGHSTENYLRIKSISVLPEYRRKGYGYQMCRFVVKKILERGLNPVLYSHLGNAAAVALWIKTGFKQRNKLLLLKIENHD